MDGSMGRATSDLRSKHLSLMADDRVDCVVSPVGRSMHGEIQR